MNLPGTAMGFVGVTGRRRLGGVAPLAAKEGRA